MSRQSFEVVTTSSAPPERVFALLSAEAGWSSWAGRLIPASSWELPEGVAPGEVGSIRLQGRTPFITREVVVENDPPHEHAYSIIGGLPVRDYLGTIELAAVDGGTRITWHVTFRPSVPGLGRPVRALSRYVVTNLARRLSQAATIP
jgi:uncharacterized protein YndB with AHSA1/START domain